MCTGGKKIVLLLTIWIIINSMKLVSFDNIKTYNEIQFCLCK